MRKKIFLLVAACLTSLAVFSQTKNSVNQTSVNYHELFGKEQKFMSSRHHISKPQSGLHHKSIMRMQKTVKFYQTVQDKQHKANKQVLDSTVSPEQKIIYQYDDRGNQTLFSAFYDNGVQWEEYKRDEFVYDANGRKTSHIEYSQNFSQMEKRMKTENTYNGNIVTESLGYFWDGSAWELAAKIVNTYNANNDLTKLEYYYMDDPSWEIGAQIEYAYDANNKLISETYSEWDGSAWEDTYKRTYTYDVGGNLTEEMGSAWDGSQWIGIEKEVRSYDANGNVSSYANYDSQDGLTWEPWEKEEYTYDAQKNVLDKIYSDWDDMTSQWEVYGKMEYVLDYTVLRADLIVPEDDYNHSVKVSKLIAYDVSSSGEFEPYDTTIYHYSVQANSIGCPGPEVVLHIYPNPVKNKINVETTLDDEIISLEVIDLTGRRLVGVQNATSIDVSMLSSGIYLLQIKTEKESVCRKIIKQ